MITDFVQRFTERKESRRPAGELIKTSAYDVARIVSSNEASSFVERHHYAATCSSTAHRFGLYCRGELVGVACFGPPASENVRKKVFPMLTPKNFASLGRFVLVDSVPGNGESWFIARCFELLREKGIVGIESCADPEPRAAMDGGIVFRGHLGTIYCATNGRYIGKTNPSTLRLLPDGTCLSNRSSGKLVRGERGSSHPIDQLERWGAEPLELGEDPHEWLAFWRDRLTTTMRHRGCHRYIWCLDRRRRRELLQAPALAYPKNENFQRRAG